jgi:hypothetical protein
MPLFRKKKKEEKKPELPELPSFSELQEIKQALKPKAVAKETALPEVPELPDTIKGVSAPAFPVKSEMIQEKAIETKPAITQEISDFTRSVMPARHELYELEPQETEKPVRKGTIKLKEPIFVKIDKFKDAVDNFELIKEKLYEIDELLKRIKETRAKEREELDSWEKEVNEIKNKVANIDKSLFSKIENL